MTEPPAFQSEELNLEDWERAAARAQYLAFSNRLQADELIIAMQKHGHKVDGYLDSALCLPLADYRRVKTVYDALPEPDLPRTRRRR